MATFVNTVSTSRKTAAAATQKELEGLIATLKAGKAPRPGSYSKPSDYAKERRAFAIFRGLCEARKISCNFKGTGTANAPLSVAALDITAALKVKPQAADWKGAAAPSGDYIKALNAVLSLTK